jgi:hypothetical protein
MRLLAPRKGRQGDAEIRFLISQELRVWLEAKKCVELVFTLSTSLVTCNTASIGKVVPGYDVKLGDYQIRNRYSLQNKHH